MSETDPLFEQKTTLSPAQRALLEKWMGGALKNREARIARRSSSDPAPLSFAQQRLWFLDQLEPGNAAYHMPAAVRLSGRLDVAALQQALLEMQKRHEILRTNFPSRNAEPAQVIAPAGTLNWLTVDVNELPEPQRAACARQLAADESRRPFNLARGPLLRVILLRLDAGEHILLLTLHHIIADGWSFSILIREMIHGYHSLTTGQPISLPELAIQYGDFAAWQRQWLQGEVLTDQLAYWKRHLANLPVLELPGDRPRPALQTFHGAQRSLKTSPALADKLKALSNQAHVTLFTTLLAAFKLLLWRHTGQTDIVIGTPIAGRNRAEIEDLIGFFINTLVLRTELSGAIDFRELLERVRETTLEAYAHQDLPFEKLVEELEPQRDLSRTPLFQVFFNMLNLPAASLAIPGLHVEPFSGHDPADSKFDLTVYAEAQNDGIQLELIYNADLYDPERMAEFLDQFELLLAQIAEHPEKKINAYDLVTVRAGKILPDPAAEITTSRSQSVPAWFARQARRFPEHPAMIDSRDRWTYRELETRGNQLAHFLRAHGIQSRDIVAVYAQRSAALVWAIMGILKAGAAFTILDPAYPPARLSACLQNARPKALLRLAAAGEPPECLLSFAAGDSCRCSLRIPELSAAIADGFLGDCDTAAPALKIHPDDLAYVAFTSGTTGTPKGILGAHRPLVHFLQWHMQTFALGRNDRFSMLSGLSHDPLLRDIFTPLCLGATLCIPEPGPLDANDLIDWLQRQAVSIVHLTPAMGKLLSSARGTQSLSALRYLFFGGDVLTKTDLLKIKALAPAAVGVNFYGATETPQAMGYYIAPPDEKAAAAPDSGSPADPAVLPLGRGIRDVQLLVLNSARQLTGIGEIGEIHVRTPYLAAGYLNDEALTRQHFIPSPFTRQVKDRLYRTGDLGCYRADGNVAYLGRTDDQIKIRGFRVEPREIEAALAAHPGVREVVVALSAPEPARPPELTAYLAARLETCPTLPEMRRFLRDKLPDYMIPSALIRLDAVPLTANGKADRRALSRLAGERIGSGQAPVAPRNPTEEMLAGIWSEILRPQSTGNQPGLGIHDNFFEMGGHSLLATLVASRIRDAFQIELPLRTLFEEPTIAGLAAKVQTVLRGDRNFSRRPLGPDPHPEKLVLSFAQQRLWFLDQLEPGNPFYTIPLAVRVNGPLDGEVLERSLNAVVERHAVLRTAFHNVAGRPIPVLTPIPAFRLAQADLGGIPQSAQEIHVRRLALQIFRASFDLTRAPLLRAILVRLGPAEQVLLLTLHHIVSDAWSMGVLIRELTAMYQAAVAGRPCPLPDLPVQYADFALWQRDWLQGEALESQLAYWKQQLHGDLTPLALPLDRPRPAIQTYRGAHYASVSSPDLNAALNRLCRRERATLFMVLLAAYKILLYRYTEQTDVVVGTPIANRNQSAVEGLIGFFVNTLVLRTDLSGNPRVRELLDRVRNVTLGAYTHQDLPFEMLVDALQPVRDMSHTPLFQTAFTLQNAPLPVLELPGLTFSPVEFETGIAKFDLVLFMAETPQGLRETWEYNTDLFDAATIVRLSNHFRVVLESLTENVEQRIAHLPLLTESERRRQLLAWNDTNGDFPHDRCIHELFEAREKQAPDALALVFEEQFLTYRALNRRANRLARHLGSLGVCSSTRVGIWMERSPEMIVGLLGILKAGGAYVPLNAGWPVERLRWILSSLAIPLLIIDRSRLRILHELQWKLPELGDVVCLDINALEPEAEPLDQNAVREFWDHLAEKSGDAVTAGGFISSYTGQPFSAAEVEEYCRRVLEIAEPYLGPAQRVLEIGCGSGLILNAVAPRVGSYLGIDPSGAAQARNQRYASDRVQLLTRYAHEIDDLQPAAFDLVILASTVQFFPGPIYLKQIMAKAFRLLSPGGGLLIADVLDAGSKDRFRQSLEAFKLRYHNDETVKTKLHLDKELYFDADFFRDAAGALGFSAVSILHRHRGFKNELGFRYDVLFKKGPGESDVPETQRPPLRKRLWTGRHLEAYPDHDLIPAATPADVAYIIHTSGSTGVPKGVVVCHEPVTNLIDWVNRTFQVGPDDRVLFVTSLCFDLSVYDIFGLLAAGGSIQIPSEAEHRDPERLLRLLCRRPVTFWDSAPAALQQLVPLFSSLQPDDSTRCLRLVFLSGDWIPLTLPASLKKAFPQSATVALGGATEATVWSNYYPVAEIDPSWASIPYGKPIRNAQYYILDAHLNPAPIGAHGDLHIGGRCLALGYAGQPDLCAARFIPDPFGTRAGARLYRTGDRARYGADGNIEFLGRLDSQVKIRGFRIELGEIETVLGRHPSVQEAVVTAQALNRKTGASATEEPDRDRHLIAYVVPRDEQPLAADELRGFLKEKLPDYMVPATYVMLAALPLTPNGKVDRRALPAPDTARSESGAGYVAPQSKAERTIALIWQELLGVEHVGLHDNFFDLGGHSLLVTEVHQRLQIAFDREIPMTDMFKHTTVAALARYLDPVAEKIDLLLRKTAERVRARRETAPATAIAIIGMSGRFPGAKDLEQFWDNLRRGVESIRFFRDEELLAAGVDPQWLQRPDYVKARAVLADIDRFDARFFGINPREAEVMDPQQRLFLEQAWHALENAGYDPDRFQGRVAVYAGAGDSNYLQSSRHPGAHDLRDVQAASIVQANIGNTKDFLATQVSYRLNLTGPSVTVQTACSTSLVAVHEACQSLLRHECDLALAGGVSLKIPQAIGYFYTPAGIVSPDGHCRPFDSQARGTLGGDGLGLVVLKRLTEALADGDAIQAVIKGSAINNDGARKIGYTAPSEDGQVEVIAEALAVAGLDSAAIGYVEAHGTGTTLGDPIEVAALTRAFRADTRAKQFCALGSVKSNFGHLDTAAGMAGLMKTVLALRYKQLPASLHFSEPNPAIDFSASPFYVNTRLRDWTIPDGQVSRRAGVSSFGIGGTNVHAVLEEAPEILSAESRRPYQLLLLSAKTAAALDQAAANLCAQLEKNPGINPADMAYTLQVGRKSFEHRRMLVCKGSADALHVLRINDPARLLSGVSSDPKRPLAFLFSDSGDHYARMARELYETEPVFRKTVDTGCELLLPLLDLNLRNLLYPVEAVAAARREFPPPRAAQAFPDRNDDRLERAEIAHPAVLIVEYALFELLKSWGITPDALLGLGLGEYTAACVSGVFSFADALTLIVRRSRLAATDQDPSSPALEPLMAEFSALVRSMRFNPPRIPYLSNVSGDWITLEEATDPEYWVRHLRQAVRFSDGLEKLLTNRARILLEIGPGQSLGNLAKQHPICAREQHDCILATLRSAADPRSDTAFLLETLGRLWLTGVSPDWQGFYGDERRRRIPLPGYPFARDRYWLEPPLPPDPGNLASSFQKKPDPSAWFYVPSWLRSRPLNPYQQGDPLDPQSCVLVFADPGGLGLQIAERLAPDLKVVTVTAAAQFARIRDRHYTMAPGQNADYERLFEELKSVHQIPRKIIHLWNVTPSDRPPRCESPADLEDAARAFQSLLFLTQALGNKTKDAVCLVIVSNNLQAVTGEENIQPEKALLLGPCRVVAQEYPAITCRSVDIVLPAPGTAREKIIVDQLLAEVFAESPDSAVAYRGPHRWIQTFEPAPLDRPAGLPPALKEHGVYLITGGLGGLGLELARYLARTVRAKLILLGRTNFPEKNEWLNWLSTHDDRDALARKIRKLQELETLGAQVLVLCADITDPDQMQVAVSQACKQFGPVQGVIHAAGVAGGGVIALKTMAMAHAVLAPKVKGTLVLNALLKDLPLDFFVLCSSLNSVLGGVGQVDYCAANAFLDAFAHYRSSSLGRPTLAINWDMWREVGMAADAAASRGFDAQRRESLKNGILTEEGMDVFSRILVQRQPQWIVSTFDFKSRIERSRVTPEDLREFNKIHAAKTYPRPDLPEAYVAPRNDTETQIAVIWEELLGVTQVGVNDRFLDLGGHSLLATQLMSRIRETFGIELSMQQVFESPTIAGLALDIIRAQLGDAVNEQTLTEVLAEAETSES